MLSLFTCFEYISLAQSYPLYSVFLYDTASLGYYFVLPVNIGYLNPALTPNHLIFDDKGNEVYYKTFPVGLPTGDFKLRGIEMITYSRQEKFYCMDSTFTVVDTVFCKNGVIR